MLSLFGVLANGSSAKLALLLRANFLGSQNLESDIAAYENETDYTNNHGFTSVNVRAVADLEIIKKVDKSKISVGDKVTYTFTVINNGPNDATGVIMDDSALTKFEFVSSSSEDYDSQTGLWTIGNLSNASSVTLTVTVIINDIGIYPNSASVMANENDSDLSNNNASSDDVNVTEEVPTEIITEDEVVSVENGTESVVSNDLAAPVLHETGNPIFMLLVVLLTAILLPLGRRK